MPLAENLKLILLVLKESYIEGYFWLYILRPRKD